MENVKAFLEKIQTDEGLQKEMKGLIEKKASPAEVVAFANKKGFNFSEADLEKFGKDTVMSGELDDEQLESVAGGGSWAETSAKGFVTGCIVSLIQTLWPNSECAANQ